MTSQDGLDEAASGSDASPASSDTGSESEDNDADADKTAAVGLQGTLVAPVQSTGKESEDIVGDEGDEGEDIDYDDASLTADDLRQRLKIMQTMLQAQTVRRRIAESERDKQKNKAEEAERGLSRDRKKGSSNSEIPKTFKWMVSEPTMAAHYHRGDKDGHIQM